MTPRQWQELLRVIDGATTATLPTGFIIDSPWLPGWTGITTLDYFTRDDLWFEMNLRAVEAFPDTWFFPGFWAEYGMCTEPSAFGARCTWKENDLPFADRIFGDINEIDRLRLPDPSCDGLMPFALNRLKNNQEAIEKAGHFIAFAVVRGPLNVASFLLGATEFLIGLRTDPEKIHRLLGIVTEYLVECIHLQKRRFDTIEGLLVLDDIIGFCGEPDFRAFAEPYLREIFTAIDVPVRFLHNDADGNGCASHLADLGVNVFNFSFLHTLAEMREKTGPNVTLVGNIPPRDVLALGGETEIRRAVRESMNGVPDNRRIIMSCGGGMPDGVSEENVGYFLDEVRRSPGQK
jgi:uroporphyrinogen decarboxylase